MITEQDMVDLHAKAESVIGTAESVNKWFTAQSVDPQGVFQFGKVIGAVGAQGVAAKEHTMVDAIAGAAVAGIELGMRMERLRRKRHG
jgi:hypothetical protein